MRYEFGNSKPVQAFGMFENRDLVVLLHEVAKECRKPGGRQKRLREKCAMLMERAGFEITEFRRVGSWMRETVEVGDRILVRGKSSRGAIARILGRAAWVEFDDGSPGGMFDLTELIK